MKKLNSLKLSKLGCLVFGICCILPNALAGNTGNNYSIDNHVMSSGGGISSAGSYKIQATIAQAITGTSNGGVYQLQSGFWHEVSPLGQEIFKNSFEQ